MARFVKYDGNTMLTDNELCQLQLRGVKKFSEFVLGLLFGRERLRIEDIAVG